MSQASARFRGGETKKKSVFAQYASVSHPCERFLSHEVASRLVTPNLSALYPLVHQP